MKEQLSDSIRKDRIQIRDPHLRDALAEARELRTKAISKCFLELSWSPFSSSASSQFHSQWCEQLAGHSMQNRQLSAELLCAQLFHGTLSQAATDAWKEYESSEAAFDRHCLVAARELSSMLKGCSNRKLRQVAKSAVDTAYSVVLMSRRIQR